MDNPWAPQQPQPAPQSPEVQPPVQPQVPGADPYSPASDYQAIPPFQAQQPVQEQPQPSTDPIFGQMYERPIPEETILQWDAPSRPYKKRNRQFYTTVGAIVVLVSLILFFAGQFLPIAVVVSVGFLAYVLSAVAPGNSTFKITTFGIRIDDAFFPFDEMGRFWFEPRYKMQVLHIEIAQFPYRISVMMGDTSEELIKQILSEVLIEQKPKLTAFEKAADWLQKKFPLDTDTEV